MSQNLGVLTLTLEGLDFVVVSFDFLQYTWFHNVVLHYFIKYLLTSQYEIPVSCCLMLVCNKNLPIVHRGYIADQHLQTILNIVTLIFSY